MSQLDFLSNDLAARVTMCLLQFLWQGVLVAVIYSALFRLVRQSNSEVRYLTALGALVVLAACPIITFCVLSGEHFETRSAGENPSLTHQFSMNSEEPGPSPRGEEAASESRPLLELTQPYILAVWIGGVCLFGMRMLLNLLTCVWLKCANDQLPSEIMSCVTGIARNLGLRRAPAIRLSSRVKQAVVVGFWRPVVLLPTAWISNMTPEMLEAVIAHELAHIRRIDLWINLFQRILESLFYYHPAVWWLSHRVRVERELCCDELAVRATGERVIYASALEQAGRDLLGTSSLAFAAPFTGEPKMNLLHRVRNVLGLAPSDQRGRCWPAGLLLALLPLAVWIVASGLTTEPSSQALADDEPREREVQRERETEGERREGDRDRERGEREDGERKREREGDRERSERDGDRREGERREGDRREGDRREGDRREGERREGERREGERREGEREGDRREGDRREWTPREAELIKLIRQLQAEVQQLRREVQGIRGDRPRDGGSRNVSERDQPRRPDAERRREGDQPRDGDRAREGDRPREGDRAREGDHPRDEDRERDRPPVRRDGDREGDARERDVPRDREDGERERDQPRERDEE